MTGIVITQVRTTMGPMEPNNDFDTGVYEQEAKVLAKKWVRAAQLDQQVDIDFSKAPSFLPAFHALILLGRVCERYKFLLKDIKISSLEELKAEAVLRFLFENSPNLHQVEISGSHLAYQVLMDVVAGGQCSKLELLKLEECDLEGKKSVAPLLKAVKHGHFKHLESLEVKGEFLERVPQDVSDTIVTSLISGQCHNLESVVIHGKCSLNIAEGFVRAIAHQKFPLLHNIKGFINLEEITNKSHQHVIQGLMAQEVMKQWMKQAENGDPVTLDGQNGSSALVFNKAMEGFGRAIQGGICTDLVSLSIVYMERQQASRSLQSILQHCPHLRHVEVRHAPAAYPILMVAIHADKCPKLEELIIERCDVDDSSALASAIENGHLPKLKSLEVHEYQEDHEDVDHAIISALSSSSKYCENLETIWVSGRLEKGDDAADTLVGAIADFKFPKLTTLHGCIELNHFLSILDLPKEEFADKSNTEILKFLRERYEEFQGSMALTEFLNGSTSSIATYGHFDTSQLLSAIPENI